MLVHGAVGLAGSEVATGLAVVCSECRMRRWKSLQSIQCSGFEGGQAIHQRMIDCIRGQPMFGFALMLRRPCVRSASSSPDAPVPAHFDQPGFWLTGSADQVIDDRSPFERLHRVHPDI